MPDDDEHGEPWTGNGVGWVFIVGITYVVLACVGWVAWGLVTRGWR